MENFYFKGPEFLCCCFQSLCANPVVHIGFPVQPALSSGQNPPAPLGSTHLDLTWKHMLNTFNLSFWIKILIQKSTSADFKLSVWYIYLDIVTSVGLGRAFRNSCTAETSLSISSSVLMWWGSSTESQVNPAWCTWQRPHGGGEGLYTDDPICPTWANMTFSTKIGLYYITVVWSCIIALWDIPLLFDNWRIC